MKQRKPFRFLACMLLVLAMVLSMFTVAFADETDETDAADAAEQIVTAEDTNVDIYNTNVFWNDQSEGDAYAYASVEGAYRAAIFINDIEVKSMTASDGYLYLYASVDDITSPGSYKFSVKAYDEDNNELLSKDINTLTQSFPNVSYDGSWAQTANFEGDFANCGYSKYAALEVNFRFNNDSSYDYEIQRSTSKSGTYKAVKSGTTYSDRIYYYDQSAVLGKTYYYKVKLTSTGNDYVDSVTKTSGVLEASSEFTGAVNNIYLNAKNKPEIYVRSNFSSLTSGYEIFRSTSRKGKYSKVATISGSVYTDKKAKAGKTYYYKVRPYNYDLDTKKTITGTFGEPQGVKIILGSMYVTGKAASASSAKITWEKVPGANGYEIYFKSSLVGDAYKLLTTTTKTSYTKKGLAKGENYLFQVRAFKKSGSKKTYFTSSSVRINLGISNPQNITVSKKYTYTAASNKMVIKNTIKWDRVFGASGIRIYVNGELKKTLKGTATSYVYNQTLTPADHSNKYPDVYIAAYKGTEEYSSYVELYADLPATKGIKIKQSGLIGAKISWSKVPGATSYEVYRYNPIEGYRTFVGSTDSTSVTDTGISPGIVYTYRVTAYNNDLNISNGSYYYYAEVPVSEKTFAAKVVATTITAAENSASKQATITWKAYPYASKYEIYRATSKSGKYTKVGTTKGNVATFTDKKLTKGKTYYYKIKTFTVNAAKMTVKSALSGYKSVKIKK